MNLWKVQDVGSVFVFFDHRVGGVITMGLLDETYPKTSQVTFSKSHTLILDQQQ